MGLQASILRGYVSDMVILDVHKPELRARLVSALDELGEKWVDPKTDDPSVIAILQEVGSVPPPSSTRELPIIHVWEMGRHPDGTGHDEGNAFACPRVRHLIGAKPDVDLAGLSSTLRHIRTGEFLGLAGLLEWGATIHTFHEATSANKDAHLGRLGAFLQECGITKTRREILETALEEMFTNAVYNAPATTNGEHTNAIRNRSERVRSKRPFVVMFGADNHHVGIAVRDYYGSMSLDRVIGRLRECYSVDKAQHETKLGGAGLGLFMMLRSVDRLVININPSQFTEFVVLSSRTRRMRESRGACPTFNLCALSPELTLRRHFRMATAWDARITTSELSATEGKAIVRDISVSGAFVQINDETKSKRGDVLSLRVQIAPDQSPFSLRGVVRWSGRSSTHGCRGIGLQLVHPLDALEAYGRAQPGRITSRGQTCSVSKIIQTWSTGGTHPGEPVTVFFRVLDEKGRILLLRHDTLTKRWAMKVPTT
ncbi:MAG: hypothetical protein A2289_21600 [Deltaproteobacteria bacterium RIFOXYA12_FULL_58_15]|nr:MAG: hypothetical protein A2289_21600 [Deltaproteobacteria bacterium RIFOXYA12_FULL_58_15]OGR15008.1 MAG: hypothetical protein A2341_17860 [Deltaproteobacteria bacterium RIFOXYB12_FULL_58_9]